MEKMEKWGWKRKKATRKLGKLECLTVEECADFKCEEEHKCDNDNTMIFSPNPLCKGYKPRICHLAVRNGNVIIIPFWNENVIIPLSYSIIVALSSSFEETFLDDLFHSKKHFYNMFSSKTSFFCSATHPFKSRIRIPINCDPSKGSVCTTLL